MGELTCYDQAKHFIIRKQISDDNLYAHTLASVASGLCATTLSCPADVIKTRMMNQGLEAKALYRNSYDCLVKTVKHEGLTALWKGFLPTWARLGPWQFVFWVSYEKLRQASGRNLSRCGNPLSMRINKERGYNQFKHPYKCNTD
ncbi:hypothetical protein TRIUR3_07454 [Triticum urartu]|uniref:Mitochondrial uncoupling protein 4 n=1 Tax=Triticum urartu TaxID=4572 RepID=M7ZIN3_TRIUA|nr:hypothetical protein TRIUR3_07454 [Triticum urartu]